MAEFGTAQNIDGWHDGNANVGTTKTSPTNSVFVYVQKVLKGDWWKSGPLNTEFALTDSILSNADWSMRLLETSPDEIAQGRTRPLSDILAEFDAEDDA